MLYHWATQEHTDAVLKKAHQRLFFLRRLRKFGTSPRNLRSFYTCTVESILTGCITAWFGNSTAGNRKSLQRVVRTAHHIVGGELPSLQDIYTRRCTRNARRIIKDSSHPSHGLLSLLPSGACHALHFNTVQLDYTHTLHTLHCTTLTHLLSLDTIQSTSTTLHMHNLLHLAQLSVAQPIYCKL